MKLFIKIIMLISIGMLAAKALAGPPFLTDDPEPVAYKHWELYIFSLLDKNNVASEEPDLASPALEINWGAIPNIQLHLIVPFAWSLPDAAPLARGIGDTEFGIKYRFIQETKNRPQIGIFPFLELPSGNAKRNLGNGRPWMKLPIWMQKSWGPWTTYGGGGYAINSAPGMRDYPYAGWLLQRDFGKHLTLGSEIFSQGKFSDDSHSFTILNVGGYYKFTDNFNLLFTTGHSVMGENHYVMYIGLYWTGKFR